MKENIFLILGIIILSLIIYDFFYTTLSSSGASFISRMFLNLAHKFLIFSSNIFGRIIFNVSGMIVNIILLVMWITLVWLGLFFIFSYYPDGIVNDVGKSANNIERLYFTGYVLSTLGMGNFVPTTPVFQILTSIFSFFGFIFFTTSMSYLLSISTAILHKRVVALSIKNLGEYPLEMVKNILHMDERLRRNQFLHIHHNLDKHIVNHKAYPVLHYFITANKKNSFGRNIAVLDEAINILYSSDSDLNKHQDINQLRNSISSYLKHLEEEYGLISDVRIDIQLEELDLPSEINKAEDAEIESIISRRKILSGLLKAEGLSWKDIYKNK